LPEATSAGYAASLNEPITKSGYNSSVSYKLTVFTQLSAAQIR